MQPIVYSPKQTQALEITGLVLLIATMLFGAVYQFMGWKLDGAHLILVGILVINYVNLIRSRMSQASARVDELEKRLVAQGR